MKFGKLNTTDFVFLLVLGLVVWNFLQTATIHNLRTDVNRVSNIQLRCAEAIELGYYTGEMWNQCIDDYLHSGINGKAPS